MCELNCQLIPGWALRSQRGPSLQDGIIKESHLKQICSVKINLKLNGVVLCFEDNKIS